jgi:hypothetical protein
MERSEDEVQPIYVAAADLDAVRLSGAVLKAGRVWWLDFGPAPSEGREWRYRCLRGSLQWIEAVGETVARLFPGAFPISVRRVSVVVPKSTAIEHFSVSEMLSTPLIDTLAITRTPEGGVVEILPQWLPYLSLKENDAEVALVAAIFKCLAQSWEQPSFAELYDAVLAAIGSPDWRWLHAFQTTRTENWLGAAGLIGPFRAIPFSAHALVRCGSVWNFVIVLLEERSMARKNAWLSSRNIATKCCAR